MSKLTAVIIAKNEEKMIADCIDSLFFCDEITVIDNESTDRTSEIAKRMKAKVFELQTSDFSKLRNFALDKVSSDWILYVDADERVSSELAKEIKEKIGIDGFSVYKIKRRNFYLGSNPWPKIEEMPRLFKRDSLKGWSGELHESPEFDGTAGLLTGYLLHFTHRDLSSMLNKTIEWSETEAKARFDVKHPKMSLWRFPRVIAATFFSYYILQSGWRLGTAGLIESGFQSFSTFITYAKLWELQTKSS